MREEEDGVMWAIHKSIRERYKNRKDPQRKGATFSTEPRYEVYGNDVGRRTRIRYSVEGDPYELTIHLGYKEPDLIWVNVGGYSIERDALKFNINDPNMLISIYKAIDGWMNDIRNSINSRLTRLNKMHEILSQPTCEEVAPCPA